MYGQEVAMTLYACDCPQLYNYDDAIVPTTAGSE